MALFSGIHSYESVRCACSSFEMSEARCRKFGVGGLVLADELDSEEGSTNASLPVGVRSVHVGPERTFPHVLILSFLQISIA